MTGVQTCALPICSWLVGDDVRLSSAGGCALSGCLRCQAARRVRASTRCRPTDVYRYAHAMCLALRQLHCGRRLPGPAMLRKRNLRFALYRYLQRLAGLLRRRRQMHGRGSMRRHQLLPKLLSRAVRMERHVRALRWRRRKLPVALGHGVPCAAGMHVTRRRGFGGRGRFRCRTAARCRRGFGAIRCGSSSTLHGAG